MTSSLALFPLLLVVVCGLTLGPNLLVNPSFETNDGTSVANPWTQYTSFPAWTMDNTFSSNGSWSVRITGGVSDTLGAQQAIILGTPTSAPFFISGYVRADNVVSASSADNYALSVDLTYSDATNLFAQLNAFPAGTYDWKYNSYYVCPDRSKQVTDLVFTFLLQEHTGTVNFDMGSVQEVSNYETSAAKTNATLSFANRQIAAGSIGQFTVLSKDSTGTPAVCQNDEYTAEVTGPVTKYPTVIPVFTTANQYRGQFNLTVSGQYSVNVFLQGVGIASNPLTFTVLPGSISLQTSQVVGDRTRSVTAGQTLSVTIIPKDSYSNVLSQFGLPISYDVTPIAVGCSTSLLYNSVGDGFYTFNLTCTQAQQYNVSLSLNGTVAAVVSVNVLTDVLSVSHFLSTGVPVTTMTVGETVPVTVTARDQYDNLIGYADAAALIASTPLVNQPTVTYNNDGTFTVRFIANSRTQYLNITYLGQHIAGSPFLLPSATVAYPGGSLVGVSNTAQPTVGQQMSFLLTLTESSELGLELQSENFTCIVNGNPVTTTLHSYGNGTFRLQFAPDTVGNYSVSLFIGGNLVAGFPTQIIVFTVSPQLLSFTAADSVSGSAGYSTGDTMTMIFDIPTNRPAVASKEQFDALFNSSQSLGTDYSGRWLNSTALLLTAVTVGTASPTVGSMSLSVIGDLLDASATSRPSRSVVSLGGSFGDVPVCPYTVLSLCWWVWLIIAGAAGIVLTLMAVCICIGCGCKPVVACLPASARRTKGVEVACETEGFFMLGMGGRKMTETNFLATRSRASVPAKLSLDTSQILIVKSKPRVRDGQREDSSDEDLLAKIDKRFDNTISPIPLDTSGELRVKDSPSLNISSDLVMSPGAVTTNFVDKSSENKDARRHTLPISLADAGIEMDLDKLDAMVAQQASKADSSTYYTTLLASPPIREEDVKQIRGAAPSVPNLMLGPTTMGMLPRSDSASQLPPVAPRPPPPPVTAPGELLPPKGVTSHVRAKTKQVDEDAEASESDYDSDYRRGSVLF